MQKRLAIIDGIVTPHVRFTRKADSSASLFADRMNPCWRSAMVRVENHFECLECRSSLRNHQLQQWFFDTILPRSKTIAPFLLGWNCIHGTCGWCIRGSFLLRVAPTLWVRRLDSNQRPSAYETDELPSAPLRNMKRTRITMGANVLPYRTSQLTTYRSRSANSGSGMMLPAP